MTPEHTKAVFRALGRRVEGELGLEDRVPLRMASQDARSRPGSRITTLQHLLWMSLEGEKLVDQGRIEKAMRWLGWLQGVLWADGYMGLEEQKQINMGEGEVDKDRV
jgi:hypothetical protein